MGGDPSIGGEAQPLDQFLIDNQAVGARRLRGYDGV
jgi:hypothetical protein